MPHSEQARETGELATRVQHLIELIQHNIQQQQTFWEFAKTAYIWQKITFELNLKKKVMNPPVFPDNILQPYVQAPSKPDAPSRMTEDESEHDSEAEVTPSPLPPKKAKKAIASKKGKEKILETTTKLEEDLEIETTP